MKIRKKNPELLFAVFYCFRFILKGWFDNNGNFDLFYLIALFSVVYLFTHNRKFMLRICALSCVFMLIDLSAIIFSPVKPSQVKALVFITKILICISLYYFTRIKASKFDFQKFLDYSTLFLTLETIVAVFQRNNYLLWRVQEGRMELFFLEPSELGNFTGLLILLQIYLFLKDKNKRYILNIVLLVIVLILSSSMSGILFTSMSILIVLIFSRQTRTGITSKQMLFLMLGILFLVLLFSTDNYISNRMNLVLAGQDSSFTTRANTPINTLITYVKNYGLGGFGLGNSNTEAGLRFFGYHASNYIICAAVFLFAIEGGIIAIVMELIFIACTTKYVIMRKNAFKFALFSFIFFYMCLGGYTTNPVVWIALALLYVDDNDLFATRHSKKLRQSR